MPPLLLLLASNAKIEDSCGERFASLLPKKFQTGIIGANLEIAKIDENILIFCFEPPTMQM